MTAVPLEDAMHDGSASTRAPDRVALADARRPVVVVGAGPAGVHFAERFAELGTGRPVLLIGEEPQRPYDRVRLSSLLARELPPNALDLGRRLERLADVTVLAGRRIVRIDRASRTVQDARGERFDYATLVLATGSRPRVPPIPGVELPGVYVFRSMRDAERLLARQVGSRCTVVIGGGLLGLEAARAMLRFNTRVHVIEHEPRLMFHQLDDEAAQRLQRHVERLGIVVHVSEAVKQIVGTGAAQTVYLRGGGSIDCDTVVVAAGILPNKELALDAGLAVGRGIRVDDALRTSDPHVYAIGECCEHRGLVYGLAAPALEQAAVAASNEAGREAAYLGSALASSLKVVGCPVFSMGDVQGGVTAHGHVYRDSACYRRLNVRGGRIVGAVAVGEWDVARLRALILEGRRVSPWRLASFRRRGLLWRDGGTLDVRSWSADTAVCTCRNVSRGALDAAVLGGACTVADLAAATGASTVCGTCRPLLAALIGDGVAAKPAPQRVLLGTSGAAGALAALACIVALPYASALGGAGRSWDVLWRSAALKQLTGYSLLALALLLSLLSLRKRVRSAAWGSFTGWRLAHALCGVLTAVVLLAHTGFRFGGELNALLMACFTGLIGSGAMLGAATAAATRAAPAAERRVCSVATWAHVLLLWPLPVLLAFHVLKGYYF